MAIDLKELEAELNTTRKSVDLWAAKQEVLATSTGNNLISNLQDYSGKITSLQSRKLHLQEQSHKVKQRLESEEQELQTSSNVAHQVKQQKETLQQQLLSAQKTLALHEQDLYSTQAGLQREAATRQKKLDALHLALNTYSSRLGLQFKQGPEVLQLVLTHIDAQQPSKEFVFEVKILEDNTYQVTRCEPAVSELPTLVQALNSSNDFSDFVKALRQQWVALANHQ